MWAGVASRRTSTLSLTRRQAPFRIRAGQGPAGGEDDRTGDDGAERAEGVAQDVQVGGALVEGVVVTVMQDAGAHQVGREARRGHGDEQAGADRRRIVEPAPGFDADPRRDRDEHRAVHEGGEDLEALQPVGALRGRRALRDARHEYGEAEGGDVGEHVAGVGEQRQGVGQPAPHRLGSQHDRSDPEDQRHPPGAFAAGGDGMGALDVDR